MEGEGVRVRVWRVREWGGDCWSEGVRLTRCGDAGVGDEGYRGGGVLGVRVRV